MNSRHLSWNSHSPALQTAVRAAAAAGETIRRGYGRMHPVDRKGVGDLVSAIDEEADRSARSVLEQDSLAFPILSEELDPDRGGPAEDLWILDPLDGSTAYLSRAGVEFPSVLIAQRREGETVLGVTYFPLTGDWYYAERGRGAWKNGRPLRVQTPLPSLAHCWVEMNQYGEERLETRFFRNTRAALRAPSGARIVTSTFPHAGVAVRVAESDRGPQAVVHDNRPQPLKQGPWDIAAPQLILEEAGGVFLNPRGERSCPFEAVPVVAAASRELACQIVEAGALATSQ